MTRVPFIEERTNYLARAIERLFAEVPRREAAAVLAAVITRANAPHVYRSGSIADRLDAYRTLPRPARPPDPDQLALDLDPH